MDGTVKIDPIIEGPMEGVSIRYDAKEGEKLVYNKRTYADRTATLEIRNPKVWNTQSPFLYDLHVTLHKDGEIIDSVESYFGLRTVDLKESDHGMQMALNDEIFSKWGPWTRTTGQVAGSPLRAMKQCSGSVSI